MGLFLTPMRSGAAKSHGDSRSRWQIRSKPQDSRFEIVRLINEKRLKCPVARHGEPLVEGSKGELPPWSQRGVHAPREKGRSEPMFFSAPLRVRAGLKRRRRWPGHS